jgi:hypothetical protein
MLYALRLPHPSVDENVPSYKTISHGTAGDSGHADRGIDCMDALLTACFDPAAGLTAHQQPDQSHTLWLPI